MDARGASPAPLRSRAAHILLASALLFLVAVVAFATLRSEVFAEGRARFTREQAILHIQAKAGLLKSLNGHFHQLKTTRLLGAPIESEGVFYWKAPDCFRWEVLKPNPVRLIVKGDIVLVHYVGLKRATLLHGPSGGGVMAGMLGSAGDVHGMEREYAVEEAPLSAPMDQPIIRLLMTPRSPGMARFVKSILATVDTVAWLPRGIRIEEANDSETLIDLSDCVEDADLPDSLFDVNPPEGVQMQSIGAGRQP